MEIHQGPLDTKGTSYLKELINLKDSGSMERLKLLFEQQADVWIKRSNGQWQTVKMNGFDHGGSSVIVKWFDEIKQKDLFKSVSTEVFLSWQDESHG